MLKLQVIAFEIKGMEIVASIGIQTLTTLLPNFFTYHITQSHKPSTATLI